MADRAENSDDADPAEQDDTDPTELDDTDPTEQDDTDPAQPQAFDPDAWGASPNSDSGAEQTVYDDSELDRERVPQARSVLPDDPSSD